MQLVSSLLVLVLVAFTVAQKPHYDLDHAEELFEKFVKDYNRVYANSLDRQSHYNAFVVSLLEINKLNEHSTSATYDINKFADYTPLEQQNMRGYVVPKKD